MTVQKSSSDIIPTKSHTKWPFYVWLDSLITTVSTPSNPECELCLPPFRVVRPGLITLNCLSSTWIVSLRLGLSFKKIVTNCKYNDCSVYALYYHL